MKKQRKNSVPSQHDSNDSTGKPLKPRRKAAPKLTLEALESRILMSATWVDADTGASQSGADNGNDIYTGTSANDTADGGSGNDILSGLAGDDSLFGGAGNDTLEGGAGDDSLRGQDGNDTLLGAEGNDTLRGGSGDDVLQGGSGNDKLSGGADADTLAGGEGNDALQGGSGNDVMDGGLGDDRLQGGKGNDSITAGEGQDVLSGDAGNDTLDGGAGDDVLKGGKDNDTLLGGAGADRLQGGAGNDALDGGEGNDTLQGGAGNDSLLGGAGNDTLKGGKGADTLDGGTGDDTLFGGAGDDVLLASGGNDTLKGESGNDTFDFTNARAGDVYTVRGGAGTDTIDLSAHQASQVQQSDGRIDVSLNSGGAFTIHHRNIESIRIGGAVESLNSPTADDGADTDDGADDNGSDFNDEAPFAVAGNDVSATSGDTITLDATESSAWEPGATLTYSWTQVDGPAVALSGANSSQPTFDAPNVATPTVVTFEVQVSDGSSTATDTVTVTVEPIPQVDPDDAPTVDAGADQTVEEGATVQLAGNATDPEGQGLTYQWVQTGGPSVTLSNPTAANPTFVAPPVANNTAATFELRVTGGSNTSVDTVSIAINAANDAPIASAGADQSVSEGAVVTLNATGSQDPDAGDSLNYSWRQVAGPVVNLSNANSANPSFSAPNVTNHTELRFEVTVSDGESERTDEVVIQVADPQVDQIRSLNYTHFRNLTPEQLDHLTPEQIATIPNTDWFNTMSADARASLDATQVQALNTAAVSIGSLTESQRESLTSDQVQDLGYTNFRYLSGNGVDHLTPQQIATIPNTDWFNTMSADARGSMDQSQVQALNTGVVSISPLTAAQREWLTPDQIQDLGYTDFRYLSGNGVDHLTPQQIATIPNTDWFNTMSADARGSLDGSQVQALNTNVVSISPLTAAQREWLTPDQIQDLGYTDFRYLSGNGVDHLTPQQIATIPNTDWFNTMSADARGSLDQAQVQGLNTSVVSINPLTAAQREWLTPDQIQDLGYTDFRYLSGNGVDHLTPQQISTIPNTDWFNTMSADARASLDQSQVQALNTNVASISPLTPDQREWLTPDQIQDLGYTNFRYLSANGVDHLTPQQISTIPNTDWFNTMSADARASLDQAQVQGLNTSVVGISPLTAAQREWLTPDQIQDLGYTNFRYLSGNGVDHLTPQQISTIPNTDWFNTMSADARASLDQSQVQALNTSVVSISPLTAAQREWLTTDQVQDLGYTQFRHLPVSRIAELTTAQVASIPNADWFNTLSADQRGAFTHAQIRAFGNNLTAVSYVGGSGNDALTGNSNPNHMVGQAGDDTLSGGTGTDVLEGGAGNDTLDGGAGNDLLIGSAGNDVLLGAAGNDTFAFENAADGDVYTVDGGSETDTIDLSGFASSSARMENGTITVDIPGGGSFTVRHQGIEAVRFSDGTLPTAYNAAPVVTAGADQTVDEGATVQLIGNATDPDNQGLTYQWVQTGGPSVTLSDPTAANPTFTAPVSGEAGQLTFELTASDGTTTSVDAVTVNYQATPPAQTVASPVVAIPAPVEPAPTMPVSQMTPPTFVVPSPTVTTPPLAVPDSSPTNNLGASVGSGSMGAGPVTQPVTQGPTAESNPVSANPVASVGNNAAQPSESSPPYNDTRVQGSRPHENQWDGAEDLGVLDPNEDLRDTLVRSPIVIPELNEPSGFAAGAGDPALASEFQVIDDLEIAIGESSSWPTADLLPADASGLHLDDVFEDMGTAAGHNAFITFDPVSDAWGVDPKNHRDDVENAAKKSGSSSRFDNEFRPRGDFAESDEDGRPMLADDEQWDHTPVAQHGLFARLWGVVRGLGASGWRNSDFHDSNANRRN